MSATAPTTRPRGLTPLLLGMASATVFLALVAMNAGHGAVAPAAPAPAVRPAAGEATSGSRDAALRILREEYFLPAAGAAAHGDSASAVAASVGDRWTRYLSPAETRRFTLGDGGRYAGIGVDLATGRGATRVASAAPGGPASRAGIRAGDVIVAVDGTRVAGYGSRSVAALIRGDAGAPVRIAVASRAGAPAREVVLTRRVFRLRVTEARAIPTAAGAVAYVRLSSFTDDAGVLVRRAFAGLSGARPRAVVLDLRHNGGGILEQAVATAGLFLPSGSPVARLSRRGSPTRVLRTAGAPAAAGLPLVVLVDHDSASASEVLAGALREGAGARVVGARTFGKGRVQILRDLPDGGALKVTVGTYATPSGADVDGVGLRPDVAAADRPGTPADEALDAAVATAAGRVGR